MSAVPKDSFTSKNFGLPVTATRIRLSTNRAAIITAR